MLLPLSPVWLKSALPLKVITGILIFPGFIFIFMSGIITENSAVPSGPVPFPETSNRGIFDAMLRVSVSSLQAAGPASGSLFVSLNSHLPSFEYFAEKLPFTGIGVRTLTGTFRFCGVRSIEML